MTELERLQRENAELRRDETRQERDDLRIRRNELEIKLAAAEADTKPVAWLYRELVNKHVTGSLKTGQIIINGVMGDISDFRASIKEPIGFIVEQFPLYRRAAIDAAKTEVLV